MSVLIPAIPALCDITSSTLQYISLNFMDPSIYVMIRGGLPITTAIFSVIFLGRKLFSHHILGLSLVVVGIALVGVSDIMSENNEENDPNNSLGLILALLSLIGTAIQFIIEEKIFKKWYVHPLKQVGLEGSWGLLYSVIVIIITSNITCSPPDGAQCNNGYLENPWSAITDILANGPLLIYVCLTMISLSFFNFCGVSVTKHVSSLARSIVSILVTVVVWAFSLLELGQAFEWLQLCGFLVLVSGNLIYNEVIEVPGFRKHTAKSQEEKRQANAKLMEDENESHAPENNTETN